MVLLLALCSIEPARAALDVAPFRAASCSELIAEYRATLEVNRDALEEMRATSRAIEVVSSSPPGVPALDGADGVGLIGDQAAPDSVQSQLAAYQAAVMQVAKEKKCPLPALSAASR
jgi:hypothetical protein